ncbi:MAG: 16S rRNA (cytosine(967)-C(5))-methyltransferase RsmB [Xanthomonadales bacterium]|nr:16S rRNA (cytosine(967)-C(5))-methyltransferase RsmB [Xanthomonadales bacterium]
MNHRRKADPVSERGANPRAAAALAVSQVLHQGRSLADVQPDQSLGRALCYGVLRHLPMLEALASGYLDRPIRGRDRQLKALLLGGLFELSWLNTASHAAVHETVAATGALGFSRARGLVNAVLRAHQRAGAPRQVEQPDALLASGHPRWLYLALDEAWGDKSPGIMAAANRQAPMWLRVNQSRVSTADYHSRLLATGLQAETSDWCSSALRLGQATDVTALPGFSSGDVSVQDLAAQLAASLLNPRPGDRVLDACAAPGGKTTHLLELAPGLRLTAIDSDADRIERIHQNLGRLGQTAEVVCADAANWAAKRLSAGDPDFQRILLDAPCSATGVIRRHPDIKWLRQPRDLEALSRQQARLLQGLWPCLAPGGTLLYATCSILPSENEEILAGFLAEHPDARCRHIQAPWGRWTGHGRQIFPGEGDADGFFYGVLEKA